MFTESEPIHGLPICKAHWQPKEERRPPKIASGSPSQRPTSRAAALEADHQRRVRSGHFTKHVNIVLDGEKFQFSATLLRDLCECPLCVDPSTKQKLFSTTDIPSSIAVRSVSHGTDAVDIQWSDDIQGLPADHITRLSTTNLRGLVEHGTTTPWHAYVPAPQKTQQAQDYAQLTDIEYDAYMTDDATLGQALKQLHTHGLLFLRNVPETETSVSAIGERIGPIKNTFYGYTWDVRSVPQAKNVAYTSQDLGFHMDLLYMHQPPHIQLLHCIRNSSSGGASLFTDSYAAAADLLATNAAAFISLAYNEVNFHYNHPSSHLYHQSRPVFEVPGRNPQAFFAKLRQSKPENVADFIEAVNWSPPFQGPFSAKPIKHRDGRRADALGPVQRKVNEWHQAAKQFSELLHRPSGIYERLMKPGECVIFDNRRVLHARKAFEPGDAGKERWLRGAYLDKDPYMSKMRVMHEAEKQILRG